MVIDSTKYSGKCSCGREHSMVTKFSVVESGALKNIEKYLKEYDIKGFTVSVYDENTYKATADRHPSADYEVVLSPDNLHANEHGVDLLLEKLPDNVEVLIAVGSGTIHDITRYCAWKISAEFVSCPTAASVDGFCSSVAAMTWHGCKKTLTAVAPKIVVADIDIIKNAPKYLAKSGFGDMIGKYIALTDWKISNILTGEFYCDRIAEITMNATKEVMESAAGIESGDEKTFEKLTYGLLMSGLAMQMFGNSRPASGAEHHISHIIEMSPKGLGVSSDALHGEKVGVGTIIAAREYHRIAGLQSISFKDYEEYSKEYIGKIFTDELYDEILTENEKDCASGIKGERFAECWSKIREEIKKIPTAENLCDIYEKLGVKMKLADINVADDKEQELIEYSPCVRNRVTLMRLRKCIS